MESRVFQDTGSGTDEGSPPDDADPGETSGTDSGEYFGVYKSKGAGPENIRTAKTMARLQGIPHSTEESSGMTRDELQAHLEASEERVGRMTDRVENKLDRIDDRFDHLDDRLDDLRSHLGERIKANRNWIIAAVLVLVSMIGYGYSQLQTLSDRVFDNAQRIEQVAPQSQPETSGAKSSPDSIQQSGQ